MSAPPSESSISERVDGKPLMACVFRTGVAKMVRRRTGLATIFLTILALGAVGVATEPSDEDLKDVRQRAGRGDAEAPVRSRHHVRQRSRCSPGLRGGCQVVPSGRRPGSRGGAKQPGMDVRQRPRRRAGSRPGDQMVPRRGETGSRRRPVSILARRITGAAA